jgi:hypothetical protein
MMFLPHSLSTSEYSAQFRSPDRLAVRLDAPGLLDREVEVTPPDGESAPALT